MLDSKALTKECLDKFIFSAVLRKLYTKLGERLANFGQKVGGDGSIDWAAVGPFDTSTAESAKHRPSATVECGMRAPGCDCSPEGACNSAFPAPPVYRMCVSAPILLQAAVDPMGCFLFCANKLSHIVVGPVLLESWWWL